MGTWNTYKKTQNWQNSPQNDTNDPKNSLFWVPALLKTAQNAPKCPKLTQNEPKLGGFGQKHYFCDMGTNETGWGQWKGGKWTQNDPKMAPKNVMFWVRNSIEQNGVKWPKMSQNWGDLGKNITLVTWARMRQDEGNEKGGNGPKMSQKWPLKMSCFESETALSKTTQIDPKWAKIGRIWDQTLLSPNDPKRNKKPQS